jgi:hypothetical protein
VTVSISAALPQPSTTTDCRHFRVKTNMCVYLCNVDRSAAAERARCFSMRRLDERKLHRPVPRRTVNIEIMSSAPQIETIPPRQPLPASENATSG